MKNPITKLTCIAILALTTLTGFKKEGIEPTLSGKWKLVTKHVTRRKHDTIILDTIIEVGQKTLIFHFKDATNLDISETDETGTIIYTENFTYEDRSYYNYFEIYGGEPNYEVMGIFQYEFGYWNKNTLYLTHWYNMSKEEDGDRYYEINTYNKM
jgi:hypothetical protein